MCYLYSGRMSILQRCFTCCTKRRDMSYTAALLKGYSYSFGTPKRFVFHDAFLTKQTSNGDVFLRNVWNALNKFNVWEFHSSKNSYNLCVIFSSFFPQLSRFFRSSFICVVVAVAVIQERKCWITDVLRQLRQLLSKSKLIKCAFMRTRNSWKNFELVPS